MKRIGPELKMPKLKSGERKVPPFLSDLYADLRDRRLLPLVALILVAIVATPILLAGGTEEPEPAPVPEATLPGGSAPASQSLTVVKAEPGLRNYKKRLDHRSPTDPFKQRFNGPQLEGAQLNEQTTTTTTTESGGGSETAGGSETSGGSPSSGGSPEVPSTDGGDGDGDPVPSSGLTYYTFAINVQITKTVTNKDGTKEKTGPTVRKEVKPPATLPGDKAQVVTYLGTSSQNHKPLFLISPKVSAVYGEGKCVAGEEVCQLIELDPGMPETFVFGENQARYKINVLKVVPVITGHS
ncbi:MAG TPA: hypothetical protein VK480_02295 [Solirubrobacterales bacterium]|nr:hypothetical protein [Solirubrobacterales bacterium]